MTRVSENQTASLLAYAIRSNRELMNTVSEHLSSGLKVSKPSDSPLAGEISRYHQTLDRMEGFKNRITTVKGFLQFQDDTIKEANDILVRAKEIAQQAANNSNNPEARAQLAEEVLQIRDHMVTLANATYQGRYVWGGADNDDPPFDAQTYTESPATGPASQRYVFDGEAGTSLTRSVQISDDLSVVVNSNGNSIFGDAISSLERLGRSLQGYKTVVDVNGVPTGAGTPYTFPGDYQMQTQNIKDSMDQLESVRKDDFLVERVNLGGRLRRLDTAVSIMNVTKVSADEALTDLQDTDTADAAAKLAQVQNSLQASMIVSGKVLNLSILNYL